VPYGDDGIRLGGKSEGYFKQRRWYRQRRRGNSTDNGGTQPVREGERRDRARKREHSPFREEKEVISVRLDQKTPEGEKEI